MKQVKVFIDNEGWTENNRFPVLVVRFKGRRMAYCVFWHSKSNNYLVWNYMDYRPFGKIEGL